MIWWENMKKNIVSVIIPVYNVEKFLRDCLDSVLKQDYPFIEIIVIDDGSTDGSGEICDTYANMYTNISVIHQKNSGLSAARNTGIEKATGKYIYFLDSDDCIVKDAISSLVYEAEVYDADLVFFDAICMTEGGTLDYENFEYIRKLNYTFILDGVKMLSVLQNNMDYYTCVPMLFIHKSLMEKCRFVDGLLHEDVLFTFELFLKSRRSVHMPRALYYRRIRQESIMTTIAKEKNVVSLCSITNRIVDLLVNSNFQEEKEVIKRQLLVLYEAIIEKFLSVNIIDKKKTFGQVLIILNKLDAEGIKKSKLYCLSKYYAIRCLGKENVSKIMQRVYNWKREKEFKQYISQLSISDNNFVLIGSPIHGNLGDHLIAESEIEFLKKNYSKNIIELPMLIYLQNRKKILSLIKEHDIIGVSGGGWLGSLWLHDEIAMRKIVQDFSNHKIIVFPQTTYYENNELGWEVFKQSKKIFSCHKDLHLFLRDKASYEFCLQNQLIGKYNKCYCVPDMALIFPIDISKDLEKDDILFCFRRDREKQISNESIQLLREYIWEKGNRTKDTTTVYLQEISLTIRKRELDKKFNEYAKAKLIITDRLHSMIFAALVGTPCIAFDNVTGKVSGIYEWIRELEYIKVVRNVEEAKVFIDKYLTSSYQYQYRIDMSLFDQLVEVIKGENYGKN